MKYAGTYQGVTLLTQNQIELKLKVNEEFELTVNDSSTSGTWAIDEENENTLKLIFENGEATVTVGEDYYTISYLGLNSTMLSAVGAKLYKK